MASIGMGSWIRGRATGTNAGNRGAIQRRRQLQHEALEDRRLLAFEPGVDFVDSAMMAPQPFQPEPILDVFARHAVTVDDMIARTRTYNYIPNELVVAYSFDTAQFRGDALHAMPSWDARFDRTDVSTVQHLLSSSRSDGQTVALVHLDLGDGADVIAAMERLRGDSDIIWSSPNFVMFNDPREFIPNDPQYGQQYHHPKMQNNLAWDTTLGDANIIIGITDDGFQLNHPDLVDNIWVNTGEIPGNGIDDDGNGYIDDVNGWDFITGNNNPNPNSTSNDHGTHVAGIAAARTNNGIGVAGVSGLSTIMPLQFYDLSLGWNAAEINAAFTYAANNGANIVTTSYNIDGWLGDPVFTAGLQYSYDQGLLLFNSAGNNNALNPPRQQFEQTLLVASTDANDLRSSFTNYGTGVDISAPGTSVRSTLLGGGYGLKSGTSMAAPNAAGAAALIWSANPTWNRDQVAAQLLATADNIDGLNPAYAGWLGTGRANTFRGINEPLGAPIVTAISGLPADGASISPSNLTDVNLRFSQILDPDSVNELANYDFRKAGPDGLFDTADDVVYSLQIPKTYRVSTNEFTIRINASLDLGQYRFSIVSGGVQNPFATPLDGNGDGTGGDHFQTHFNVAPAAVNPPGSLLYQQVLAGQIVSGQTSSYSIDLDAGQTLTVHAASGGTLQAGITVMNPDGIVLFDSTTDGAVAQALPVSVAGNYQIDVYGMNGTSGNFQLQMVLNGLLEDESITGVSNNTPATAEDITTSAVALGDFGSDRMAVVGRTGFFEDFESGEFGAGWTTYSSNAQGQIAVSNARGGAQGTQYAVLMDRSPSGQYSLNEAIWTVNLSGFTSAMLSFYHADFGDEEQTIPLTYTGHAMGDGVSISNNGVNWYRVLNATNVPANTWQLVNVDLVAAAAAAGMPLNSNFQIKFQQYDDFPMPTDGRGYDQMRIVSPSGDVDWYSFTLQDGETATAALTQLTGTGAQLQLYAADGTTLLRSGATAQNVSSIVNNFVDTTSNGVPDTYLLRVTSSSDYSLVVTRNADFDTESNAMATPQNITGVRGVLGHLSPGSGEDAYLMNVAVGTPLNITATFPGDGPHHFINSLSGGGFQLELRDPSNAVVATGANSVSHVAATSGNYVLRVSSQSASGEYFLDLRTTVTVSGDFNQDGIYDCADIDSLTNEIAAGTHNVAFDMTGDGLVNLSDLQAWLAEAGAANLPSGNAYLSGDANLDGDVDGSDFGIWNSNKFTFTANWCEGDFNADGVVDGSDFGLWNSNKFTSALIVAVDPQASMARWDAPRSAIELSYADGSMAMPQPVVHALPAAVRRQEFSYRAEESPRSHEEKSTVTDAVFSVWDGS